MVDEAGSTTGAALFSHHDDGASVGGIGVADLLGDDASPFTDDHHHAHDQELDATNLDSIFDDAPNEEDEHPTLPSLNSPLAQSPQRSANSSVGSAETIERNNHSLGLPGNEIVEQDWRNDAFDLRARKDILLQM